MLRPLIHYSRDEIAWLCRTFYLPVWSDITNYNFIIQRNRVRNELIPYLKNYFNPQIQTSLNKFLQFCQCEDEYIKENTLKLYIKSTQTKTLSLNFRMLYKQHTALQQRVIKLFFYYHFQKQIPSNLINHIITLYKHNISKFIYFDRIKIYHNDGYIYTYNRTKKYIKID